MLKIPKKLSIKKNNNDKLSPKIKEYRKLRPFVVNFFTQKWNFLNKFTITD